MCSGVREGQTTKLWQPRQQFNARAKDPIMFRPCGFGDPQSTLTVLGISRAEFMMEEREEEHVELGKQILLGTC